MTVSIVVFFRLPVFRIFTVNIVLSAAMFFIAFTGFFGHLFDFQAARRRGSRLLSGASAARRFEECSPKMMIGGG
jgi:hypothetical protein